METKINIRYFNGLRFTEQAHQEWRCRGVILRQRSGRRHASYSDFKEIDAIGLGDTPEEALEAMGRDLKHELAPLNQLADQLTGEGT